MCGFRLLCNTEEEEEREEGRSDGVMRVGKREQFKKNKIGSYGEPGGMKSNTADWTMTKASGRAVGDGVLNLSTGSSNSRGSI